MISKALGEKPKEINFTGLTGSINKNIYWGASVSWSDPPPTRNLRKVTANQIYTTPSHATMTTASHEKSVFGSVPFIIIS